MILYNDLVNFLHSSKLRVYSHLILATFIIFITSATLIVLNLFGFKIGIVAIVAFSLMFICYFLTKSYGNVNPIYLSIGSILILSLAVFCQQKFFTSSSQQHDFEISNLTWSEFQTFCASDGDFENRNLHQQIACAKLKNSVVKWKGHVQAVKLTRVENFVEVALDYLPEFVGKFIR